jgi:uncharacterized membrane protein YeaQ/YmgE (transglycosylase-associated protein family)
MHASHFTLEHGSGVGPGTLGDFIRWADLWDRRTARGASPKTLRTGVSWAPVRRSRRRGPRRPGKGLMEIIGVIVAGIIIGLSGKFVAPGDKDNIPLWLTIVCGIGGVIIGWFIYTAFGGNGSAGVDWVRWIVAIATAAVLVVIASSLTGRNRSKNPFKS